MSGVRTSIQMYDGMTAGFVRLAEAISRATEGFTGFKRAVESHAPVEKVKETTNQIKRQTEAVEEVKRAVAGEASAMEGVKANAQKAAAEVDSLNQKFEEGGQSANKMKDAIAGIAGAVGGIYAVKKAVDFLGSSFESFNRQQHGELQLKTTLANMGAEADAFDKIAAHAQEIQKAGIYGDDSMIAGAAEFATYMSDPEAIISMMDTLSNYAMGMSGGGELSQDEMVNYATNIGKICTGAYDAMTRKGFEFTEAQKAVIDGTATEAQYVEVLGEQYESMSEDMRAAATINQIIAESWEGLYAAMSNTPEGKVIALKNAWDDFKEMLGGRVAPTIGKVATMATNLVNGMIANWSKIAPVIMAVVGALGAYITAMGVLKAITLVQTAIEGILNVVRTIGATIEQQQAAAAAELGVARLGEAGATGILTGAQIALNAALSAMPFAWIAIGIGIVIALIYKWVQSVGGITIAWQICKTAVTRAWEQMKIGFQRAAFAIISYANHMNANVLSIVQAMVNGVISLINMLISALNALPGVSIQAISQVSFGAMAQAQAAAFDMAAEATIAEEKKQSDMNFKKSSMAIKKMQMQGTYSETSLIGGGGADSYGDAISDIAANTGGGGGSPAGQTAGNTGKMADKMDVLDDILEYMVDIAERETVNRFTTAEINIEQTNNNAINSNMDIDGIMEKWNEDFTEILEVAAEGVHV